MYTIAKLMLIRIYTKFAFNQLLCIVSEPPTNLFSIHGDIHLPDPKPENSLKGIAWTETGDSIMFGSLLGGTM